MQGSEPRTPLYPPINGGLNQNKSRVFSHEEHKTRINQIWADYDEYRRILGDMERRIETLEEKRARAEEEEKKT